MTKTLPAGAPSWVDLGTRDVQRAIAFYDALFGWRPEGLDDGHEHDWFLEKLEDAAVAGVGGIQAAQPQGWTTFILCDDANQATSTARASGGSVLTEPLQAFEYGTTGILADPLGAHFAIWQPDQDKLVADRYNAPGALCRQILYTPDLAASGRFYAAVFGWTVGGDRDGAGGSWWEQEGAPVARAVESAGVPGTDKPGWLAYFGVANLEAALSQAVTLGARVTQPAGDTADGRTAVVADFDGNTFGLIEIS